MLRRGKGKVGVASKKLGGRQAGRQAAAGRALGWLGRWCLLRPQAAGRSRGGAREGQSPAWLKLAPSQATPLTREEPLCGP